MPGFGQSLAYVIVPSIPTDAFAPNVAVASPFAKLSVSAARAMPGTTAAASSTAVTQTIRNHLFPTISGSPFIGFDRPSVERAAYDRLTRLWRAVLEAPPRSAFALVIRG